MQQQQTTTTNKQKQKQKHQHKKNPTKTHKIKSRYLLQILDICTFGQVVFQKP
jgi:hypothetical protein